MTSILVISRDTFRGGPDAIVAQAAVARPNATGKGAGARMDTPDQALLTMQGALVALGPLRRELVPLYQRWMNDPVTARNVGMAGPVTLEAEEAWYDGAARAENTVSFTVYERETLRPVGVTQLMDIHHRNRRAEFGITIGEPDARGRGYGTETARLMLDYAFTALGLHNVRLTVAAFNPAGIRAYERAGFREYGRRREAWVMGGRAYDEVHMDCLSTEFESPVLGRMFAADGRER
jgi:RimJ/RimL family protein N-acetyltransferase